MKYKEYIDSCDRIRLLYINVKITNMREFEKGKVY